MNRHALWIIFSLFFLLQANVAYAAPGTCTNGTYGLELDNNGSVTCLVDSASGTYSSNITLTGTSTVRTYGSGTYTISGTIDGSGPLTVTQDSAVNTGAVTFSASNSYTGGTSITQAVTAITSNANGFGTSGTITLASGGKIGITDALTIPNSLYVDSGQTGYLIMNYDSSSAYPNTKRVASGGLTGSGTLDVSTNASSTSNNIPFLDNLLSGFAGTFVLHTDKNHFFPSLTQGSSIDGSSVALQMTGSVGPTETNSSLAQSWTFFSSNSTPTTIQVGALSGDGTLASSNGSVSTYQVGALNTSTTFSGTIRDNLTFGSAGAAALTKVGTGKLTLTGNNYYSATTTVNAGELQINGTNYAPSTLGCGNCSGKASSPIVVSGGTLSGTGTVGVVTVANTASSTLQAGTGSGNDGTLTTDAITFAGTNARLAVNSTGTTTSKVVSSGTVTITGLTVDVADAIATGTYTILQGSSVSGATPILGRNNSGESVSFSVGTTTVSMVVGGGGSPTYTVTYNGNSNTGGSVPVDASNYNASSTVTVLGNTGSLTRTGYGFVGWNTASDGSGTSYLPDATFSMPAADTTLYAVWSPVIAPNDSSVYYSPYNWVKSATSTITNSAGAYFKTKFTGTTFKMEITPSSSISQNWPKLAYIIDGEAGSTSTQKVSSFSSVQIASTTSVVDFTSTALSEGTHTVQIWVDAIGRTNRFSPADFVQIDGFIIDPDASLSTPDIKPNRILQYGDSITEGWTSINASGSGDVTDNQFINDWAFQQGNYLNAEVGIRAFAGQGYHVASAIPGVVSGSYGGYDSSWNYIFAGNQIDFTDDQVPDLIINNHGTNGSGTLTEEIVETFVSNIRGVSELEEVPIVLLRPITTANSVSALSDAYDYYATGAGSSDRQVYLADNTQCSSCNLHPLIGTQADTAAGYVNSALDLVLQPGAPQATSTIGTDSITISWSTSTDRSRLLPTEYRIYKDNALVSTTTNTTYTDTGLAGTSASYYVTAVNGYYSSVSSDLESASSTAVAYNPTSPSAPGAPTFSETSSNSTKVNWSAPDDGGSAITSYTLYRREGTSGSFSQIATPSSGDTSYTDSGLSASTVYQYYLTATNTVGTSSAGTSGQVTTSTASSSSGGGGGGRSAPSPIVPDGGFVATAASVIGGSQVINFSYGSDITTIALSHTADFAFASYLTASSTIAWPTVANKALYAKFCNQYMKCSDAIVISSEEVRDVVPTFAYSRDLTVGARGTDVVQLQEFLITHGYEIAAGATGYFGAQTQNALALYQKRHDIEPALGYFGPITRASLTVDVGDTLKSGNGEEKIVLFTRDLTTGSVGDDVRALQEYLNSKGFTVAATGAGSADNETTYFGSATQRALVRFQETYSEAILSPVGLVRGTGYFGPSTRAYINSH